MKSLFRSLAVFILILTVSCQTEKPKPKNLILLIGDGMGIQQLSMLFYYASHSGSPLYPGKISHYQKLSEKSGLTLMLTNPGSFLVTDSACSATQLATGRISDSEMIGLDRQGRRAVTILEKAKAMGLATGLVSDTRITHATPAAFASHRAHRSQENEIAEDLLETRPDVMLSAGIRYFLPAASEDLKGLSPQTMAALPQELLKKSSRKDNKNLLLEAEQAGYELAFTKSQMNQADSERLLGLFASSAMMDGPAWFYSRNLPERTEPTLREMTEKALNILSKNKKGFFLMVEAGQIDWAGHNNDSGTLLYEMLKMDETLKVIADFASGRDDTVVIVTADHETGGFGFSYHNADIPAPVSLESEYFNNAMFRPDYNFVPPENLAGIAEQKESCFSLFRRFGELDEGSRTAPLLARMLTENYSVKFTVSDADALLKTVPNPRYNPDYKSLKFKEMTPVADFSEFYPYPEERKCAAVARMLAVHHGIAWSTGTHTATPVPLLVYGPESVKSAFRELMHSSEAGDAMQKILGL